MRHDHSSDDSQINDVRTKTRRWFDRRRIESRSYANWERGHKRRNLENWRLGERRRRRTTATSKSPESGWIGPFYRAAARRASRVCPSPAVASYLPNRTRMLTYIYIYIYIYIPNTPYRFQSGNAELTIRKFSEPPHLATLIRVIGVTRSLKSSNKCYT